MRKTVPPLDKGGLQGGLENGYTFSLPLPHGGKCFLGAKHDR